MPCMTKNIQVSSPYGLQHIHVHNYIYLFILYFICTYIYIFIAFVRKHYILKGVGNSINPKLNKKIVMTEVGVFSSRNQEENLGEQN